VSLATHCAGQINMEHHLLSSSKHIISPQLLSFLLSSVLRYPHVTTVSSTVRVSCTKWNLRNGTLNFITDAIIYGKICDFHCLFSILYHLPWLKFWLLAK